MNSYANLRDSQKLLINSVNTIEKCCLFVTCYVGNGGRDLQSSGSVPPPFRNLGNFVHPSFACVFEETLKAGGPFYMVSMSGEIKDYSTRENV